MDKKEKEMLLEKLEKLENRKQKIMEQAIWHDGEMDLFSEEMCNAGFPNNRYRNSVRGKRDSLSICLSDE